MKDIETWVLAITLSNDAAGTLTSSSDYQTRINNPSEFTQTSQTFKGYPVVIFTDNNAADYSKTAFILRGNLLATISLRGGDKAGNQPLQTSLNMILNSWNWKY